MLNNIGLMAAYAGVGLGVLIVGFFARDMLTPGALGSLIMEKNKNAAVLSMSTLISLGFIMFFAIFFTGSDWSHLDDAAVYGAVGVLLQAIGFFVFDLLTPFKLGKNCLDEKFTIQPCTWMIVGVDAAMALIVAASLT